MDGARGEGGGQLLRTALALTAATGTALQIDNVRAGRWGRLPQHLAAARAVAALCGSLLIWISEVLEPFPGSVARAGDDDSGSYVRADRLTVRASELKLTGCDISMHKLSLASQRIPPGNSGRAPVAMSERETMAHQRRFEVGEAAPVSTVANPAFHEQAKGGLRVFDQRRE